MSSLFGKRKSALSAKKTGLTDQDSYTHSQPTTPTPHPRPRSVLLPMITQPHSTSSFSSSTSTGTFSHALKLFSRRRSLSARATLEDSNEKPRAPLGFAPQLELNFTDLIDGHPRDGCPKKLSIEDEESPEEKQKKEEKILENIWFKEEEVREFFDTVGNAMKGKGFATPGLFLPHKSSQSPSVQHALLIYFAQTHRPNLFSFRSSSLSVSQPSPQYLFITELKYALNVHDLASVIRFSLRHLDSSKGMSRRALYDTFAVSEREAGYPSHSWSTFVPEGEDREMIRSVLEVLMSAASVVDTSGVSIGKLSMIIGFWVFRSRGWAVGEREERGVEELFKEWEIWGRRLEHLLLAYIRDQSSRMQIQTRLLPLIQSYPNNSRPVQSHSNQAPLLEPTPHHQPVSDSSLPDLSLTTHRLKRVLHLQIRASPCRTVPLSEKDIRARPIQLIEWALEARIEGLLCSETKVGSERKEDGEALALWIELRRQAKEENEMKLEKVFTREAIRILGIPLDKATTLKNKDNALFAKRTGPKETKVEKQELYRPFETSKSSFGLQDNIKDHKITVSPSVNLNRLNPSSSIGLPELKAQAWTDFSLAGFGDSPGVPLTGEMHNGPIQNSCGNTPWEKSLGEEEEGSKRISARSLDMERIMRDESIEITRKKFLEADDDGWNGAMEVAGASILGMDEAFIEFSQDIQLDPGSVSQTTFPTFAMYELKASSSSPEWLMVSVSSSLPLLVTRTSTRIEKAALTPITPIVTMPAHKSRRQTSFLESLTPSFFGNRLSARSSIEERPLSLSAEPSGRTSGTPSQEASVTSVKISTAHSSLPKLSKSIMSEDHVVASGVTDRGSSNPSSPLPSPSNDENQLFLGSHDSILIDERTTSTGPLRRLRSFLGGKNILIPIDDDQEENSTPTKPTLAAESSDQASSSSPWTNETQEGRIVDIGRMPSPCPVETNLESNLVVLGAPVSDSMSGAQNDIQDEPSVDIGNDSDLAVIAEIMSSGEYEPADTQERDRETSGPWEGVPPEVEVSSPSALPEHSVDNDKQESGDDLEVDTPPFISIITPAEDEDEEVSRTENLPSEDSQESVQSSVSERSTQKSELGSVATTVESFAVKTPLKFTPEDSSQIQDLGQEIFVEETMIEETGGALEGDTPGVEYKPMLKQLTLLARPHSPSLPPPLPARSASRERLVRPIKPIAPEMIPLPSSP